MDRIWSPWRQEYIVSRERKDSDSEQCVFCELPDDPANDEKNFVVYRASLNYVVLNIFPYNSGHLLIVPYEHIGDLDAASEETTNELMALTKRAQTALREAYKPSGFNIGMNLGEAGGAGFADHIHIHILPRWTGDTNFMSTIADTRVLPEDLAMTYRKLREHF